MLWTYPVQHWLCQGRSPAQIITNLLQRKLCDWEEDILNKIRIDGMHKCVLNKPRIRRRDKSRLNKASIELETQTDKFPISWPVNFMEALEILYKTGVDFNCVVAHVVKLLPSYNNDYYAGDEAVLKVFKFLLERGVGISNSEKAGALQALSRVDRSLSNSSRPKHKVTQKTVKLFELLFTKEIKSLNSMVIFLWNVIQIDELDDNVCKIVRLFLENGFYSDESLRKFCSDRVFRVCLYSPDKMRIIFSIYELLIEHAGSALKVEISRTALVKLHEQFESRTEAPRTMELISFVVDRGIHVNGNLKWDETLLTSLCQTYTGDDLPEIINFLCSSGFDVNHVNSSGENALIRLAMNPLNYSSSTATIETIRILVRRGIGLAGHQDNLSYNAAVRFLYDPPFGCCSYSRLSTWNDFNYWEKLNLLIDSGCELDFSDGGGFLFLVLHYFAQRNLCQKCALQHFGMKIRQGRSVATPGLSHFHHFLDFVKKIIQSGAKFVPEYNSIVLESPIIFACSHYKGDELVALVELLCEHGFDVNARSSVAPSAVGFPQYFLDRPKNAIEVLRNQNRSEVDRIEELTSIMTMYGFVDQPEES